MQENKQGERAVSNWASSIYSVITEHEESLENDLKDSNQGTEVTLQYKELSCQENSS